MHLTLVRREIKSQIKRLQITYKPTEDDLYKLAQVELQMQAARIRTSNPAGADVQTIAMRITSGSAVRVKTEPVEDVEDDGILPLPLPVQQIGNGSGAALPSTSGKTNLGGADKTRNSDLLADQLPTPNGVGGVITASSVPDARVESSAEASGAPSTHPVSLGRKKPTLASMLMKSSEGVQKRKPAAMDTCSECRKEVPSYEHNLLNHINVQ